MENFTIPLSEESYDLTKQFFWNLIRIRYDWTLPILYVGILLIFNMPFLAKMGDFVSLRHTHIRNITSILLKEVSKDERVEPQLHQLTGKYHQHSTAAGNEVRLDISARGFR